MNRILHRAALALITTAGFGASHLMAAPFTVALTDDATTLAQAILGGGISIVGTPTLSSQPGQSGSFTNFSSGPFVQTNGQSGQFNIASGILLTTGIASGAEGNYMGGPNADVFGSGDPQLDALSGANTFDASILTIQFTTVNPFLLLQYAFASAEYPASLGTFSDVFGIFVNGVNVALVPGTAMPVSINTVNADVNADRFTQYSTPATPFNYGGITTLLTARANVSTNSVNTIRIAIADSFDGSVDSAVFIEGGSLAAPVPEPATVLLLPVGGLFVAALVALRRRAEQTL
jgi:hypothetical protein